MRFECENFPKSLLCPKGYGFAINGCGLRKPLQQGHFKGVRCLLIIHEVLVAMGFFPAGV